jgi:hypothetical protein
MARNRGISKAHSQITVKTGLAGWGGRIRTSASGIVPKSRVQDLCRVLPPWKRGDFLQV